MAGCGFTRAAEFSLIVGVDALRSIGSARSVEPVPGPGFAFDMFDGDRLAGTSDVGGVILFEGVGVPMFPANAFGALSTMYRRGSVPLFGGMRVPILAVDYLGGPLLDLDGDLTNPTRSLVPVPNATAVVIPGSASRVDLVVDFQQMTIELASVDMTSTNPGGDGIPAEIATTINVLAGTSANGLPGDPINPAFDTRVGDLVSFEGTSGGLVGVYRIEALGYEIWQDSIAPFSSSAAVLGTLQFLGSFRGWLVVKPPGGGSFPTLAGEGLGTTLWPAVDTADVGVTVATANGLQGGGATIFDGVPADQFTVCDPPPGSCNGGTELTDFGGDLGAYFDSVVVPALSPDDASFVYLESAGFGLNNSNDPVFIDSVGYDVVIVAASRCGDRPMVVPGDLDVDNVIDINDWPGFVSCATTPGGAIGPGCGAADVDRSGRIDVIDYGAFQRAFGTTFDGPACGLEQ